MNLLGVNAYIQSVIEGFIIVLAVAFDVVTKSRKTKKVIMVADDKKEGASEPAADADKKPEK